VSETGRLRRAEFAVAAFGSTAVLLSLLFVLDAVRFHHDVLADALAAAARGEPQARGLVLVALALFDAVALTRVGLSLSRGVLAQRRVVARLPVLGERELAGRRVTVIAGRRAVAFCAGLARPRIYVSQGALERLGAEELAAIVAHEAHHARRRDPLRILVARAIGRAFGRREQELADLSADRAAARGWGAASLASALLAFHADAAGIAAVRVDHLTGEAPRAEVPRALAFGAGVVVCGLLAALAWTLAAPGHPTVCLPLSSAPLLVIGARLLAMAPAWLGLRRAAARLRPAA
jgi:Zn-dependent protease with chaperone function